MSDFENLDASEIDPAAEFLAREQDELAGLEDVIKPAAISAPSNDKHAFESDEEFTPSSNGIQQNSAESTVVTAENNSSPMVIKKPKEEPEKIRKWREEQIKRLEEKDREEEKKKEELRIIAAKELEDWYKNHNEIIAKTKQSNRDAEKQFVADEGAIKPGTEWERIAKLCDFNPKAKPGSKDISRMRSIVLQLKQQPVHINHKA